ncbi:MAG: 2-oxoacid:acceptor oxidoreductase family protein, partial [Anaerolineae bacterium]
MAVDRIGRDLFTFLVGGKAGEGVKKAGSVASSLFADMGRHVFQMDDYQSLIRGGHNFSVVSTAVGPISSHYMQAQFAVSLDDRSFGLHREHLAADGVMVYNSDTTGPPDGDGRAFGLPITSEAKKYPRPELRVGVAAPAALCAALGLDKAYLRSLIEREYRRDLENNIPYAESIYDLAYAQFGGRYALRSGAASRQPIMDGAQAIALGAIAAGLDLYFAYPMTPSSSLLHFLASHAKEFGIVVEHPENEIAVANLAIGAAAAGARA